VWHCELLHRSVSSVLVASEFKSEEDVNVWILYVHDIEVSCCIINVMSLCLVRPRMTVDHELG
jgi:hypothetical protein